VFLCIFRPASKVQLFVFLFERDGTRWLYEGTVGPLGLGSTSWRSAEVSYLCDARLFLLYAVHSGEAFQSCSPYRGQVSLDALSVSAKYKDSMAGISLPALGRGLRGIISPWGLVCPVEAIDGNGS